MRKGAVGARRSLPVGRSPVLSAPLQTEHVRATNRHAVYRALATGGRASRPALVRATGLSTPTVAAILDDLVAAGVVRAAGRDADTGGRPAQRFALDPDARHVLAVDLSGRRARACRVDLLGHARPTVTGPELGPGAEAALHAWLRTLAAPAPAVTRLAVAVPGVVDPLDGHVRLAPALGWHDDPVGDRLEAALGVPALLENDVNALALAELHYGIAVGHEHAVFVAIGSGIGASLVVHGRLARGAHAAAGEIGYATSATATESAEIGVAGGPLERDLLAHAASFLATDGTVDLGSADRVAAFAAFAEGLRPVLHVLVCALDPELVVVAWPADPDGRLATALHDLGPGRTPVRVVQGALGPDAALLGVAHLALERVEADVCRSPRPAAAPPPRHEPTRRPERTVHA